MDSRSVGVGHYGCAAEMATGFALHPCHRCNCQLNAWSSSGRALLTHCRRGISPPTQPASRHRQRPAVTQYGSSTPRQLPQVREYERCPSRHRMLRSNVPPDISWNPTWTVTKSVDGLSKRLMGARRIGIRDAVMTENRHRRFPVDRPKVRPTISQEF